MDEKSGVILKAMTTFANTPDIYTVKSFTKSINNIDKFYADKAYKSEDIKHLKTHMKQSSTKFIGFLRK